MYFKEDLWKETKAFVKDLSKDELRVLRQAIEIEVEERLNSNPPALTSHERYMSVATRSKAISNYHQRAGVKLNTAAKVVDEWLNEYRRLRSAMPLARMVNERAI